MEVKCLADMRQEERDIIINSLKRAVVKSFLESDNTQKREVHLPIWEGELKTPDGKVERTEIWVVFNIFIYPDERGISYYTSYYDNTWGNTDTRYLSIYDVIEPYKVDMDTLNEICERKYCIEEYIDYMIGVFADDEIREFFLSGFKEGK